MPLTKNTRKVISPEKPDHLPSVNAPQPPPGKIELTNKQYYHMIIELILYYGIGLQPSDIIDEYIDVYMKEMNLDGKSLVEEKNRLQKETK